jgi:hypothetical protein
LKPVAVPSTRIEIGLINVTLVTVVSVPPVSACSEVIPDRRK